MNPFGTPVLNGVNAAEQFPEGYIDVDFTYVYDVTLTALQQLRDQAVPIHVDSDFALRAVILAINTGAFSIRFSDSQGYYLSSGFILSGNFLSGSVPYPYPIFPELLLPAGSRLGIEINDLSNAGNTIQILFRGAKRYHLPRPQR